MTGIESDFSVFTRQSPVPGIIGIEGSRRPPGGIFSNFTTSGNLTSSTTWKAGKAAGIKVIATTNGYTENEDLSSADIIVTTLGDEDGERGVLRLPVDGLEFDGVLYLDNVMRCFSA